MTEKDKEDVQSMIDKTIDKLLIGYLIGLPIATLIYCILDSLTK